MLHRTLLFTIILFIIMLLVVFSFHEEELKVNNGRLTDGELVG
ncbi:hypothetical protein [Peribacillus frigoritolerans]|nr:hypothetical protein [Peribacillus frigoritolerans]